MNKAIIILHFHNTNKKIDIEVPLNISAKEFVIALNEAYDLKIETEDISKCYLRCDNPIALLKGDKTLQEFRLRNGSIINII